MNVVLRRPMSRDEFFAWAGHQDGRWEFDGVQPVAMTGGTLRHDRLTRRLHRELGQRLAGRPCEPFGPEAGVATVGDTVRYPDAVVTCTPIGDDLGRLVPDPVIVFEVISPTSGYTDKVVKLREYAAVSSILRYVIVESEAVALTDYARDEGHEVFRAAVREERDTLFFPEIGIEIPVAAIYEGILASRPDGNA